MKDRKENHKYHQALRNEKTKNTSTNYPLVEPREKNSGTGNWAAVQRASLAPADKKKPTLECAASLTRWKRTESKQQQASPHWYGRRAVQRHVESNLFGHQSGALPTIRLQDPTWYTFSHYQSDEKCFYHEGPEVKTTIIWLRNCNSILKKNI